MIVSSRKNARLRSTRGYHSRNQTPERRRRSSPRKRRSLTPMEGRLRKHHRDRYERFDSDWEREKECRSERWKEGITTTHDATRRALKKIVISPLSKRLQDAQLLSRVKHSAFVPYEMDTDPWLTYNITNRLCLCTWGTMPSCARCFLQFWER